MPNQQQSAVAQASQALLPRWANDQDGWSRAIADDVLKNRVQPSDLDIDHYLKLLLSEKKLSPEPFEAVPEIEENEVAGNPLDAVRLESLKVGDGINALKPGAQIDFAPGVTVIFGENGSGKSGFVRVLKRAAGLKVLGQNCVKGQNPISIESDFICRAHQELDGVLMIDNHLCLEPVAAFGFFPEFDQAARIKQGIGISLKTA
jgi:hypothetical protein